MAESSSPYFWLNSGGIMTLANGIGMTNQGEIAETNRWRRAYAASNALDTDNGFHPQNIFRLVTRTKWRDVSQEMSVKILKDNLSTSPNRNASNGVLFFNRYRDSNTLYYTGMRVDGGIVVKKKINGVYYTMVNNPFFAGDTYDRQLHPNLLPKNIWIGLRSDIFDSKSGKVYIKVYVDVGKTGRWVLGAEAVDDGQSYGGAVISEAAYAGVRTDFMDVVFDDYRLTEID